MAGKKHYFGVGGGTRQFKHLIEDAGKPLEPFVVVFAKRLAVVFGVSIICV